MNQICEDAYIYLDLTKETLKKKDIIKAVKSYIEEKKQIDQNMHFSILIFREDGTPIFISDKEDADIIVNSIEENWSLRSKEKSYFENGLFYIFSFLSETIQKKSKVNRVIVITDTPSDLASEYQEALFNLVSKIKHFPTFIDIIRIAETGERFFKDDVKLNILASDTKGGIFYIQDKNEFFDVLKKLVKNKQLISTFEDRPDKIEINVEDFAFYDNLAKELKKSSGENLKCWFCGEDLCPKCSDINDILLICEGCRTAFHECCISKYVENNNIGIPYIFRCPNCSMLLKVKEETFSEEFIQDTEGILTDNQNEKVNLNQTTKFLNVESKEFSNSSKEGSIEGVKLKTSIEKIIDHERRTNSDQGTSEVKIKNVRIGGFFGKEFVVKKVGNKIIYDLPKDPCSIVKTTKIESEKSEYWSSTKYITYEKDKKVKIRICSICGTNIQSSEQITCHNCGNKL